MVLPASMRLKGYRCFNHLKRSGRTFHGPSMVLRVVKAKPHLLKSHQHNTYSETCKCAVAISSKVNKKSVIRNKLRRIFHSHLTKRLCHSGPNLPYWALISLKPVASKAEHTKLLQECDRLLNEAGLAS